MAKAPAMQLYVRDWFMDVVDLDLECEGAWIRACCKLHLAPKRGFLSNDIPTWARILRCSEPDADRILRKLGDQGIARVRFRKGKVSLVSRRMEKERKEKEANALYQARHRAKGEGKKKVRPPSASAVSAASATAQKPPISPASREEFSPGFEQWWAAYPKGQRKRGKPKCWKLWKREKLEARANDIITCLAAAKKSRDWKKDKGQYIPGPHPWLNSAPWLTEGFAKDAADGPVPGWAPQMGADTPEDLETRAWTYELTAAQRQEWYVRAEKEMQGQPKPLVWAKARKLWQQDRLRAAGKD